MVVRLALVGVAAAAAFLGTFAVGRADQDPEPPRAVPRLPAGSAAPAARPVGVPAPATLPGRLRRQPRLAAPAPPPPSPPVRRVRRAPTPRPVPVAPPPPARPGPRAPEAGPQTRSRYPLLRRRLAMATHSVDTRGTMVGAELAGHTITEVLDRESRHASFMADAPDGTAVILRLAKRDGGERCRAFSRAGRAPGRARPSRPPGSHRVRRHTGGSVGG